MEPWFDPQTAGKIGGLVGSCFGIAGGVIGGSCWYLIQKGWKKVFYGMYITVIAVGVIMLIVGVVAFFGGQPRHVWYVFGMPGLLVTFIFSSLFPMMRKRITEDELRKMQAKDL